MLFNRFKALEPACEKCSGFELPLRMWGLGEVVYVLYMGSGLIIYFTGFQLSIWIFIIRFRAN